jgi:hypothetical protein
MAEKRRMTREEAELIAWISILSQRGLVEREAGSIKKQALKAIDQMTVRDFNETSTIVRRRAEAILQNAPFGAPGAREVSGESYARSGCPNRAEGLWGCIKHSIVALPPGEAAGRIFGRVPSTEDPAPWAALGIDIHGERPV